MYLYSPGVPSTVITAAVIIIIVLCCIIKYQRNLKVVFIIISVVAIDEGLLIYCFIRLTDFHTGFHWVDNRKAHQM